MMAADTRISTDAQVAAPDLLVAYDGSPMSEAQ